VGGAFIMRSRNGEQVMARGVDPAAWPFVLAVENGCVWRRGTTLLRLRPSDSGGFVEVIQEGVATVGGGKGVVAVVTDDGRLLVLDVRGGRSPIVLRSDGLSLNADAIIGANGGELAVALPSGELALWTLSSPLAPPAVVKPSQNNPWSIVPLGDGLVALGTEERVVVVHVANRLVLLDEPSRGAAEILAIQRDREHGARRLRLQVGTNLGGVRTFDLSPLVADRCAVLREVWATSPVSWERGQAVPRPPPNDHPCALETTTANSTTTTTSITATPLVPAP
jgi:hypothetical protein